VPKGIESGTIRLGKVSAHECAWDGCTATFDGDKAPEGWAWLILYRSGRPHLNFLDIPSKDVLRDAALCPTHARQLERRVKDSGGALSGPTVGSS
jgi:hypothetical protein